MLRYVIDVVEMLDTPKTSGASLAEFLRSQGAENAEIMVKTIEGEEGLSTDFVRVFIPGSRGKSSGGSAPTLGIIGRLGGAGARPERIGFVSDGDGCAAALSAAAKLLNMSAQGDVLPGDVIITTHVTGWAPTEPHDPVPFMGSPVDMETMNDFEVEAEMDAIVSIDTTKGNRTINHRGIAISPTVKSGYILRPSEDLVSVTETVTGVNAVVFPLATQDITPYGNDLHHVNSILQPAVATDAPVVGVAITTAVPVAGCATGASHATDIELASRFAIETAKYFGAGQISFYDADQFAHLVSLYGEATHLQTLGRTK
ncbi:DUF1177 domain-containing protein [Leucobacter chinensis]|uniref:DUF1177 domain-containing protein n=1 Tax=Leucobacter chinensis TaxID=2851010 RepID=UPI001C240D2D|nr:DUF1177 domain-containing protein [Leucobacter chinensis]